MNQPYVKEYLKDANGDFVLNEKGQKIVTNPIPEGGYISLYPNQRMRSAFMKKKKFNNRKGRHYYQPKMSPVYDPIGGPIINTETGEREKLILYSVPTGSTIKHHVQNLPRKK